MVDDRTFYEAWLAGDADTIDVDDYKEKWRKIRPPESTMADHLGLTEREYTHWVDKYQTLETILLIKAVRELAEEVRRLRGIVEDRQDASAARDAQADAKEHGTVPWGEIRKETNP